MPRPKPKNTWVFVVSGVLAIVLVVGVVLLDELVSPINGVIRFGALLGYLAVFLASLSSNYMRELTRYFGRPFPKVHHVVSVTALVAIVLHTASAAWKQGSVSVYVPDISSVKSFFELGGRPAFWLIAITALTAVLRAGIGKSWKTIHWLNYLAFLLGTVHGQLYGRSFKDHVIVRIVSSLMAATLLAVFAMKRLAERRRRLRRAEREAVPRPD